MDTKQHPAVKEISVTLVANLIAQFPAQIMVCLPDIIPAVSALMNESKASIKDAATATMTAGCALVGNRDIEAMIPVIISCIKNPAEVQDCVHKLASTTFVQQVEAPCLALMVPLLLRGMRERVSAIKRKAALICDNMAKLVDKPTEALVFLPRLMPELEKVSGSVGRWA